MTTPMTEPPGGISVTDGRYGRHSDDADVVVVGAGPGGSTAAYYLAQAGLDVLLLEKSTFPREKVCGDGLTPRSVRSLVAMGIDTSPEAGWLRNRGLRVLGAQLPQRHIHRHREISRSHSCAVIYKPQR